ncbi:MAG: hypothetical protein Q8S21_03575 [Candidatus Paracaedibacteraceae bacterium]|nr:hypothetical protein [Candidatus Paracaedibacteraceae bacterium]
MKKLIKKYRCLLNIVIITIFKCSALLSADLFDSKIPLNREGACYVKIEEVKSVKILTLDIRSRKNRRGELLNLEDIMINLYDYLKSKNINRNDIKKLLVKNLDADVKLDFISLFPNLVYLDLYTSHTYSGIWGLIDDHDFPALKVLDLRGNHVGHGHGKSTKAIIKIPTIEQIIVSEKDVDSLMDKKLGLGKLMERDSSGYHKEDPAKCVVLKRIKEQEEFEKGSNEEKETDSLLKKNSHKKDKDV